MRIIVIGGGIAGLSAAHRLTELSSEKKVPLELLLLEGKERLGGAISTKRADGFVIEEGPDSFITTKPWALNLSRRLGLEEQFIQTSNENRRAFIVHGGKLKPVPEGFLMMAPSQITQFLTSSLFSIQGKLRIMYETMIAPAPPQDDESLASFVRRRLGQEALERAAQPLISSIYTADPEKLSLRATMPQFLEMEQKHGSIIKGMLRNKDKSGDSGARYSLFLSFKDGMQTLVGSLASRLPKEAVRLNQKVQSIIAGNKTWTIVTAEGREFSADGVIFSTPSYGAASLVKSIDPALADELSKIEYASTAVVSLAYKREDVWDPLEGFGFVVPAVEKLPIIACSFSSVKFAGRAPKGYRLLRCYVGGALQPEIYEKDDSAIIDIVEKELSKLLKIKSTPVLTLIHRHHKAMPQCNVGHLNLVAAIEERLKKHKGIAFAGNAYNGVGIPDCVRSGETAAESVFQSLL